MVIELSDYIAAGSLLVAFIALVKSFISDRKVKKLDLAIKEKELALHQVNELDQKKADIEVEMVESPGTKFNRLRFYNKGKAVARNISFQIVSDEADNNIVLNMKQDFIPYPLLQPYQRFEVSYHEYGEKPYHTFIITWDDDFAQQRSKEMVVEL